MVYIDDNTREIIKKVKVNSIYYVVNFDNVITDGTSCDTFNAITNNVKLKNKYIKKADELNLKSQFIELDKDIEFDEKCNEMKYVWKENLELIKSLNIDNAKLKKYVINSRSLMLRDGVKDFLTLTYERNIPVIIISDGIADVIKFILNYNECNYDNIHIVSNCILEDDKLDVDKIVHPLNKSELFIPSNVKELIKEKKTAILLASSISNINMLSGLSIKGSIKVAFLDKNINENFDTFLNYFNIICTHNTSFKRITDKLRTMK